MLESYKWDGLDGMGWKSLKALILRAPLCGANKVSVTGLLRAWQLMTNHIIHNTCNTNVTKVHDRKMVTKNCIFFLVKFSEKIGL